MPIGADILNYSLWVIKLMSSMTAKALTLLILLFCTISIHVHGRGLSPLEFGLKEANNAIERFWVLHRTHTTAIAQNTNISYHGIDTIRIEIPIKIGRAHV